MIKYLTKNYWLTPPTTEKESRSIERIGYVCGILTPILIIITFILYRAGL